MEEDYEEKIILELEKDILDILKILQSKSEKSYIVGGYIRDVFKFKAP